MKIKNITRYTYESTDFLGWRVSIQRRGRIITRYFSDLKYGSEDLSLAAAVEYRDRVIEEMKQHRDNLGTYMDEELHRLQALLHDKDISPREL